MCVEDHVWRTSVSVVEFDNVVDMQEEEEDRKEVKL